jgi:hypothetical protein
VYASPRPTPLDPVLYELEASVLAEETERREAAASSRVTGVDEVIDTCYLGLNDVKSPLGVVAKRYVRPPEGAPRSGPTTSTIARDRVT